MPKLFRCFTKNQFVCGRTLPSFAFPVLNAWSPFSLFCFAVAILWAVVVVTSTDPDIIERRTRSRLWLCHLFMLSRNQWAKRMIPIAIHDFYHAQCPRITILRSRMERGQTEKRDLVTACRGWYLALHFYSEKSFNHIAGWQNLGGGCFLLVNAKFWTMKIHLVQPIAQSSQKSECARIYYWRMENGQALYGRAAGDMRSFPSYSTSWRRSRYVSRHRFVELLFQEPSAEG